MERVDLFIKNARIFNVYFKKFMDCHFSIRKGKFYYIDYKKETEFESDNIIDLKGKTVIPGFIDIHMHIESSMLTPLPFCEYIGSKGITTIVAEPHEIANVAGVEGVEEMILAGEASPIDVYYGIPSSVPSTHEDLETTGGIIGFEEMKELAKMKNIACVGEVMNYRGVIRDNNLEITKFIEYIKEKDPSYIVEGHCPLLLDLDLAKFLYLGINGDHTEHSLEEIKQRYENGMFVEIQEKMLRKEIIDFIVEQNLYEHTAFVTDDVMVDDLWAKGHLDHVVRKAIDMGFPLEEAIYCASYTPANRMNLRDRGAIAPGKIADFIVLEELEYLKVQDVYKKGVKISQMNSLKKEYQFKEKFYHSIHLNKITEEDFKFKAPMEEGEVSLRAMVVQDGSTQLKEEIITLPVEKGIVKWENTKYLLATVFERYGKEGSVGYGFVTGDGLKRGAVASTWVHDHHNLLVVGSDVKTMVLLANQIIEQQGGMIVGEEGKIIGNLPLPIGGIMSEDSVEEVASRLKEVRDGLLHLGYQHYNPIMSVGTYGLVVSPFLKITNKGLVDVQKGELVDLFV
ncbi:MAG: adenine deaminase C-terminal domain-containing protein [Tissierellia bacterium]|nr:adenine deaminase C-terminal domain-containing protein [Tissierellia bacterium]